VLAGTESVRSDLVTRCGLPRDRVTLLPFAVEPPNAASRAIGRQFVLGLDLRVAGGRIETVCEALARAIAGGLDARLLVATGDVRVRAVITAAATAHGLASRLRIEDLDARALVQRCDGLAHADSDAVPALAVLAALAARVPAVVASDCGVLELVREAVLAVPADDVGALAEALHQVAEPDRRRTLAHAGQELARTRFAVDVVGEAAVGLYRGAIGDRGDPGAKAETATLYRRISGLRSGTTPPPGTISR
jgi:glycosyltransferase involved in cell wall biosynthesis